MGEYGDTVSFFKNIFEFHEEDPAWQKILMQFPNRVPRFETKAEAVEFTRKHCTRGSNPDTPHLLHSISTLISWEQIEQHLLPRIREYETKWPAVHASDCNTDENRFITTQSEETGHGKEGLLYDYLLSRLDLPIHQEMSFQSTLNTLRYLFFHMKCGIYVMIRNNAVVLFCPFVNTDYRNSWSKYLKLDAPDGQMETYYESKKMHYRAESIIPNMAEWWANGNIICNEYSNDALGNQFWGDHFLFQLKDMLAETCRLRKVPDCEFFLNKRDYPQLKFNKDIAGGIPVEPYGFIFDRDDRVPEEDIPLCRHLYRSYAPIMSFYSSDRFADIPIPPSEDWESATGQVFPSSFIYSLDEKNEVDPKPARDLFTAANLKKFERPWSEKIPVAFFRGTATGGGVTPETNQRVHLAQLCHDWQYDVDLNGSRSGANGKHPYLDAKITGWNLRDKKIASQKMTHIRPKDYSFSGDRKKNFVEIYKQSTYKYLLYVEGHCAACRYGFMMQLGSVILKVESQCVADQMWYFPLLQPYVDHVPVKADLSDLREVLEWCHAHDEECQRIAACAKELYRQYISRDGVLDYMQAICIEVSKRWCRAPDWAREPPPSYSVPQLNIITNPNYAQGIRPCTETQEGTFMCSYCDALIAKEKEDRERERASRHQDEQQQASDSLSKKERDELRRKRLAARRRGISLLPADSTASNQVDEGEPPAAKKLRPS